ncbi:MAG: YicC/YloC family endoribonuclease [Schwartzia sp. (in: firmicutes)]
MLRSMTGFGAGKAEDENYRVSVEVKAVNQRFLDVDLRMPYTLDAFAEAMKGKVRGYAARGKLTVSVQFVDKRELPKEIRVDQGLAKAYHAALHEISAALQLTHAFTVAEIAAYPGVLTTLETASDVSGAKEPLLFALEEALQQFVAMREAEGGNLKIDLLARLNVLEDYGEQVAKAAPEIVEHYRERLQKNLGALLSAEMIEPARIVQEVAMYADKVNYTEEIVRLRSHVAQFRQILEEASAPVGRKLDFLIQEMNREVNTTASKANHTSVIQMTVEMKSEIEKLREQIQNIE